MITDTTGKAVNPVVVFEEGSYWFWNETWDTKYGPFGSYDEAMTACAKYAREL